MSKDKERNIVMHTGRGGAIMIHEKIKGRKLTAEERLEFEEGSYDFSTDNFGQFTAPRRTEIPDGVHAFNFKRDGTEMYVVEQYSDGYRFNHKYVDKEEFEDLIKGMEHTDYEKD